MFCFDFVATRHIRMQSHTQTHTSNITHEHYKVCSECLTVHVVIFHSHSQCLPLSLKSLSGHSIMIFFILDVYVNMMCVELIASYSRLKA